jgi:hypothetical protein
MTSGNNGPEQQSNCFLCSPITGFITRLYGQWVLGLDYWTEAVEVTNTDDRPDLSSEGAPYTDDTMMDRPTDCRS